MNCANHCANHADAAVSVYCQQCGKPLCAECARPVGGTIFCESCLQARLGIPPGGRVPEGFSREHASPILAAVLGFIPGVGAMYNGQFAKALAHVLIFAVFVSLSDQSFLFGWLVAAWVFYQVFDAYETAKARRDGLPLPNPFGLNDLASRIGIAPAHSSGFSSGASPNPGTQAPAWTSWSSGASSGAAAPAAQTQPEMTQPSAPPVSATPYETVPGTWAPPPVSSPKGRIPAGAIALIVIGILLLFQTLGILRVLWLGRDWPVLIIGLGVWLLVRRMHETPRGGQQ